MTIRERHPYPVQACPRCGRVGMRKDVARVGRYGIVQYVCGHMEVVLHVAQATELKEGKDDVET